jgi:hypothetical protein
MSALETYHDYARELEQGSLAFRRSFVAANPIEQRHGTETLRSLSKRGWELVRTVASAVRADVDYNILPQDVSVIGAFSEPAAAAFGDFERTYVAPFTALAGFQSLPLREGLNKIMHTDPRRASFRAGHDIHEMLLVGTRGSNEWIAVVSIPRLYAVLMALPDRRLEGR